MITEEECMSLVLQMFPGFSDRWQTYLDDWQAYIDDWPEEEKGGLCLDVEQFALYVEELILSEHFDEVKRAFELVEQLIVDGDEDVSTAVATCLVEYFANVSDRLDISKFTDFLGPESRGHWKAWDGFTGVYTEGLWGPMGKFISRVHWRILRTYDNLRILLRALTKS